MSNKTAMLRDFVEKHPGATLNEICAGTGIARAFVSTLCARFVRTGLWLGSSKDGYTWLPRS
jgi:DNA-binding IclR family transcriptional regulator